MYWIFEILDASIKSCLTKSVFSTVTELTTFLVMGATRKAKNGAHQESRLCHFEPDCVWFASEAEEGGWCLVTAEA
jgi:hypothetical protein